jgi:hypothetical protein
MGNPPERHHDLEMRGGAEESGKERPALVDFGGRRLVGRRHAADRIGDPTIDEFQAV